MSRAKEAQNRQNAFIKNVEIENYKSIQNVNIDFKPGLNIIIGRNSSGKTNFLKVLDKIMNGYSNNDYPDTTYTFAATVNSKNINIQSKSLPDDIVIKKGEALVYRSNQIFTLSINGQAISIRDDWDLIFELGRSNCFFMGDLIEFDPPYNSVNFVNSPLSTYLTLNDGLSKEILIATKKPRFLSNLFKLLFNNLAQKNGKEGFKNLEVSILKDIIDSFSNKIFSTINYYLNIYSPIEKIRISPDYKITKDTHNGRISLSNFYLEFRINETWINYGLLSDGTKRLFYILTELIDLNDEEIKGQEIYPIITLLEEPELGIHPHQLHKLMQFIKEQSEEKQIILTTHSPQVLDVLGPDELDRIIICYYDNEKGTQLRHLTEREMEKAKSYIQDEFLSDYWIHSDLEETN